MKEIILNQLSANLPDVNVVVSEFSDELTIQVHKKDIVDVCKLLKNDEKLKFIICEDVTAIDWARKQNRFTVVYHIFSLKNKFRLVVKADVDESECKIDTVSSVWRAANWHEREVYDMYGIKFNQHPDLRRMYMPEEFDYHPLRKDFPVIGIEGSLPLPKK
ncbi:MAG: NADH-quinone oxidoreductase subunit C [Ignavibacteriaceae bacterium]|nr:NADH-quinone oxidoreductase subunit C [Ignavibacteriaceae bacterium]